MNCDICSKVLSPDAGNRIPNRDFRAAVSGGFNPYEVASFQFSPSTRATQVVAGLSKSDLAAGWKTRALRDATDWVLCGTRPPLSDIGCCHLEDH